MQIKEYLSALPLKNIDQNSLLTNRCYVNILRTIFVTIPLRSLISKHLFEHFEQLRDMHNFDKVSSVVGCGLCTEGIVLYCSDKHLAYHAVRHNPNGSEGIRGEPGMTVARGTIWQWQ